MLFGRGKGIIGLDIGSRYIKLVQLKEVGTEYHLERIGVERLLPELIVDGSVLDSPRVAEVIKDLIQKTNIRAKDATIAISGHASVIIKKITMPLMSEEEAAEQIKFEAEQYIPFDIEDVNLDFHVLGELEDQEQMDVLILAVKKDKINEYVSVVQEAGLNPVIVDVDTFALENMFEINYGISEDENLALINIGASKINMNIIRGEASIFTRDSSVGSSLHSEALQREFQVSYDDAERLKLGHEVEGVSPDDVAAVLNAASEEIIAEVSRSFEYFSGTTSTPEDIHGVILSGGCALVRDFAPMMTERLGINVDIFEPFRNIRIPDNFDTEYLKNIEPLLAVAAGLAIRKVGDK